MLPGLHPTSGHILQTPLRAHACNRDALLVCISLQESTLFLLRLLPDLRSHWASE